MHEMALTRDVVDVVIGEAGAVGATAVRTVYLEIGMGRDIVEDIFVKMFAYMARDTVAGEAELIITRPPFLVRCNSCGNIYHLDVYNAESWNCRVCKKRDYELHSGMEFNIRSVELAFDTEPSSLMTAAN